ncbi:MAG: hypothetical protein ACRDQW_14185, partial [Haloechinothrix sp.]
MSQELHSGVPAPDEAEQRPGGQNGLVRAPSATRRVRARLARRITAQRPASVKQVLEPLVAVHRE